MGLWPSCVKTAPRKVAVRWFVITEQVIYICIFSSAFDTPLDFFGRSLLKQPYTAWYATHTGSPSGHHQWRLKSDEEKERVRRERERERERERKWKGEFFTQRTEGKKKTKKKRHSISKRRPCFDRSVLIWWTIAQRLQLLGLPSYPFCHRLQSNFCHQNFGQRCLVYVQRVFCVFIKPRHSELAACWKRVPWLPLSLPNFSS